jgi:FAD synthase
VSIWFAMFSKRVRFESVDDLVAQMNRDVDDAKGIAESASYG